MGRRAAIFLSVLRINYQIKINKVCLHTYSDIKRKLYFFLHSTLSVYSISCIMVTLHLKINLKVIV